MGEEKRHQMMQNLFGDQSEEEEEEEEVESEQEALRRSIYHSDEEGEGEAEIEGEGEAEVEGEGEADVEGEGEADVEGEGEAELEGEGEAEVESEGERPEIDVDREESEGERVQSSHEREVSDHRQESGGKDEESDEQDYGHRAATSRRREVIASESEGSEEHHSVENGDDEIQQIRTQRLASEDRDVAHVSPSAADIRDVFGDSDEDEAGEYAAQNDGLDRASPRSPAEEEGSHQMDVRPEDLVLDEDGMYESEEENFEQKQKEKPVGPPLELEIPLCQAPGQPEKMNMIKVSNIMGIEPKPFDPKTYVEEDVFVTDESGAKKRIRLEDNIVRWRNVRNRDGTISRESNARFVRWSDGSLQLLIGNEVLDISVQDAQHDQTHLFLRHGKGILQSQGQLLRKMRFMPSSLSSKSHRLLTALVDSRHKKIYKVKNCITDIDPEREKEEKEKALNQTIRSRVDLLRKQEKVNRKYSQAREKEPQLSPGYLEGALEEEDEAEDYVNHRRAARRHFEEDLEVEERAEKRILNAKRSHVPKEPPRKTPFMAGRSSKRQLEEPSESEREESEYESEGEDERLPSRKKRIQEEEEEEEEEGEEEEEEEEEDDEEEEPARGGGRRGEAIEEDEEEEDAPKQRVKESGRRRAREEVENDDEESPPRKQAPQRRRMVFTDSEED
ncbi:hypothetical protein AMTRI_Chr10g224640 [Amborella trichopoda]